MQTTELQSLVNELDELVRLLYDYECVGGPLHIVTDDGNIDDGSLLFCYRNLNNEQYMAKQHYSWVVKEASAAILFRLFLLTEPQRLVWWLLYKDIERHGVDPTPILAAVEDGMIVENENGGYDSTIVDRTSGKVLWEGYDQMCARLDKEAKT